VIGRPCPERVCFKRGGYNGGLCGGGVLKRSLFSIFKIWFQPSHKTTSSPEVIIEGFKDAIRIFKSHNRK